MSNKIIGVITQSRKKTSFSIINRQIGNRTMINVYIEGGQN